MTHPTMRQDPDDHELGATNVIQNPNIDQTHFSKPPAHHRTNGHQNGGTHKLTDKQSPQRNNTDDTQPDCLCMKVRIFSQVDTATK